ncbi:MAG: CpsD/CapB family tyrosine-protein kinase [Candidatus Acidiferrum sp.]
MSRIHEALKKAAQQRNTVHADPSKPKVDLSAEGLANAVLPENRTSSLEQGMLSGRLSEGQIFQEFVKQCSRPGWRINSQCNVFSPQASPAGAERFRTLRSRLFQIAATNPLRRVVVTSSVPEEGKTFVVANLAQSFARQPECRVLLIDGDLRASRLHIAFGAPELPGLSDYLSGGADETQITQVGGEGNLCLIPGGRSVPNPSELLHCDRMKLLLDKMSHIFDWILVDSPPTLAVHDASVLADICDGVLFVVRAGSTEFEVAERASAEFREKNLLGVVLNRVEKSESYGGYYYGYPAEKHAEPAV